MVDFDKGRDLKMWIMEHTGGPAAGGLTVRDVIAVGALGAFLEGWSYKAGKEQWDEMASAAYRVADSMLDARITLPPRPEPTVEEAFGL